MIPFSLRDYPSTSPRRSAFGKRCRCLPWFAERELQQIVVHDGLGVERSVLARLDFTYGAGEMFIRGMPAGQSAGAVGRGPQTDRAAADCRVGAADPHRNSLQAVFVALVRGCGQAYALQTVEPVTYRCGTRRVLPSSVIRFRTLHASTASRRCPDELRARRQSPTIDVYRKHAFSTRACWMVTRRLLPPAPAAPSNASVSVGRIRRHSGAVSIHLVDQTDPRNRVLGRRLSQRAGPDHTGPVHAEDGASSSRVARGPHVSRRWCTTLRLRRGSCRLSGHGDRCGCTISTMRSKVHPKYKAKYRVGNWSAYEQALVQRGDVTLWLSADATTRGARRRPVDQARRRRSRTVRSRRR